MGPRFCSPEPRRLDMHVLRLQLNWTSLFTIGLLAHNNGRCPVVAAHQAACTAESITYRVATLA